MRGAAPVAERAAIAHRVRSQVLELAGRGGCFVGSALSCADLLVHLYTCVLRTDPGRLGDRGRDYFLLSKGHDATALYAVLAATGFLPQGWAAEHLKVGGPFYWHPSRAVPGIEFHSGSLGHLLSVGIGIAEDVRLSGDPGRVFVLMGDGELNEGSVWEAALVAAARRLDNLVAVIDRNGLQANAATEDLVPLEPLAAKLEAFGWATTEVDGHSFAEMDRAFGRLPLGIRRPSAVVARTVRGRGVPSLEGRADRWFVSVSPEDAAALVAEMDAPR